MFLSTDTSTNVCVNFNSLYLQHDGGPLHNATAVLNYINDVFQRKLIGCRGVIEMPIRSLDLTTMGFFSWGFCQRQGCMLQNHKQLRD